MIGRKAFPKRGVCVCKEDNIDKEENVQSSSADDEQKDLRLMLKGASDKLH
jgi:hypothetical protein